MARFARMQVLNEVYESGLIPIFHHPDFETARNICAAIRRGGCRLTEFVNRGDRTSEIFGALDAHFRKEAPDLILGVGSVMDAGTAALFLNAGASFIVGPILNPEVARICNRRKIPYFPGCGTATEISQAEELGCEICKIFPGGAAGGPGFISSVLAPMPWSSLMPTGGVAPTRASIQEWIHAGASALGMGGNLIAADDVRSGNWKAIENAVRQALTLVREARTSHPPRHNTRIAAVSAGEERP